MIRQADVIVVGAGIAGLVAASEVTAAGRTVALVDQEGPADLGGQAYWSLGGLFLVDTPEQRRLGVEDSFELAWSDWQGSAQFDRLDDEDGWAVRWARAYVEWAAGDMRSWLHGHGITFTPTVGCRLLDPAAGPLVAVKLHILTRKTLGGMQTDLEARALDAEGKPIAGLYAAGEVAGFGGGGLHGYNALEGTFLGGCLFSGRAAGRAAAAAVV